jgi:hypothetical protein
MSDPTAEDPDSVQPVRPGRWTALISIAVLGAAEILILVAVFALDTPLRPIAERAAESPSGILVLVASILLLLCLATAAFWAVLRRHKSTR